MASRECDSASLIIHSVYFSHIKRSQNDTVVWVFLVLPLDVTVGGRSGQFSIMKHQKYNKRPHKRNKSQYIKNHCNNLRKWRPVYNLMIQSQLNAQVKYASAAAECWTSTIRHEILCCCLSLGRRLLPSRGQHLLFFFTIPSISNFRSCPLHDL